MQPTKNNQLINGFEEWYDAQKVGLEAAIPQGHMRRAFYIFAKHAYTEALVKALEYAEKKFSSVGK